MARIAIWKGPSGQLSAPEHVATQFSQVQSVIDGMLVDRPRRRIIRNHQEEEA